MLFASPLQLLLSKTKLMGPLESVAATLELAGRLVIILTKLIQELALFPGSFSVTQTKGAVARGRPNQAAKGNMCVYCAQRIMMYFYFSHG